MSPDPSSGSVPEAVDMLAVTGLVKHYASGETALRGVDLRLRMREVVALIGPSGAGKSTLIRCVNRLVDPSEGSILFEHVDLAAARGRALRRKRRRIGMIFQEHALVERLTVMQNLLCGRLGYVPLWRSLLSRFVEEDIARARALLDRLDLRGHENKRVDKLSGGQRQRVGIARALMQEPRLLLVDEPTASLDPKTSSDVMRMITELVEERGLAAIINIHDVPLARRFASRVVGLREGSIVFDGLPSELSPEDLLRIYGEDPSGLGETTGEE